MLSISSPQKKADATAAEDTPFTLRNASSGFEGRSTNIFGQLDTLEQQHASHEQSRTDLEEFADLRRPEDKDNDDNLADTNERKRNIPQASSDQEGEEKRLDTRHPDRDEPRFRRPAGRPPGRQRGRGGRVPNHGNKPHTWTRYTLDDVTGSDMSDKANTQAALAFLDERRKLKAEEEMEEEAFDVGSAACSKGAFSFAKRSKSDKSSNDSHEKDQSSEFHSLMENKSDKPVSDAKLGPSSDAEADPDTEQSLDEETAGSSSSSAGVEKTDATQTGFKNRKKGIRRNIRARDDD